MTLRGLHVSVCFGKSYIQYRADGDKGIGCGWKDCCPLYIRINPITDPHKWSILEYMAGTNLG